ncbi:TPA: autoinducer binding domain-containing protein [Klebsiella aerogenes]|nr:autoinducer binding domain-containing protein [Klebsiella aerogenes]
MLKDPLDVILQIKSENDLYSFKQRVREVALAYGCDRSVLFSVTPVNENLVERIFWVEGNWFDDAIDAKTYMERCPVNQHLISSSRPFYWYKTGTESISGSYQIASKPVRGALHGIQIPVFGNSGIEGAFTLGGMNVSSSPKAELILTLLGVEAFHSARRIIGNDNNNGAGTLTAREKDVLKLVSKGMRQKDIAGLLGISQRTVENHLRQIRNRLGVSTTAQAIQVALTTRELRPGKDK